MTFSGLEQGQDLENRAAHFHQEFPGVRSGDHLTTLYLYLKANYIGERRTVSK